MSNSIKSWFKKVGNTLQTKKVNQAVTFTGLVTTNEIKLSDSADMGSDPESLTTKKYVDENNNLKKYKLIDDDYTLQTADEVLFVDNTVESKDITITIPLSNTLPQDGLLHEYWVYVASPSDYEVSIQLTSPEKFPLGHSLITLKYAQELLHLGGGYGLGWATISSIKIVELAERVASWSASNFSSLTAVILDTSIIQDDTQILEWNVANPTRITCKVPVRVNVSYLIDLDSTGGGTWICTAQIRKNGTELINGTETRTGNYGGEDQSSSSPEFPIDMQVDDYLELVIDQNNLTGRLVNATLNVNTTI